MTEEVHIKAKYGSRYQYILCIDYILKNHMIKKLQTMQKVKTLQRQVLGIRQSCWTLLPVGGVHRLCMFMEDSNASSSRRRACSQWLSISRHMSPLMSQPQQVGYATQKITIYNEASAKLWTDLSNIKRDCSISEWMSSWEMQRDKTRSRKISQQLCQKTNM